MIATDSIGLVISVWIDSGEAPLQVVETTTCGNSPVGTTSTGRLIHAAYAINASAQYIIAMATGRRTEKSINAFMGYLI